MWMGVVGPLGSQKKKSHRNKTKFSDERFINSEEHKGDEKLQFLYFIEKHSLLYHKERHQTPQKQQHGRSSRTQVGVLWPRSLTSSSAASVTSRPEMKASIGIFKPVVANVRLRQ